MAQIQVLTYRGKSLKGMIAGDLRGVIDDMAETYRRRLVSLRYELEQLAKKCDAINKARTSLEQENHDRRIRESVKKLDADLTLDG